MLDKSTIDELLSCPDCFPIKCNAVHPVECDVCGETLSDSVDYIAIRVCFKHLKYGEKGPYAGNPDSRYVEICDDCRYLIENFVKDTVTEFKKTLEDFKKRVAR